MKLDIAIAKDPDVCTNPVCSCRQPFRFKQFDAEVRARRIFRLGLPKRRPERKASKVALR